MYRQLFTIFPVPVDVTPDTMAEVESLDDLEDMLIDAAHGQPTTARRDELGEELMHRAERLVMLNSIDMHWRRHLTDLDVLREGIGLMAIAQRDPLVEYKREAFEMFQVLQNEIHAHAVRSIFRVQVNAPQQMLRPRVQVMQAIRPGAVANTQAGTGAQDRESLAWAQRPLLVRQRQEVQTLSLSAGSSKHGTAQ